MKIKTIYTRVTCALLALFLLLLCSCNSTEPTDVTDEPSDESNNVYVVRSRVNVKAGEYFSTVELEIVKMPESEAPEGYCSKKADVLGRMLIANVKEGDIITESILSPDKESDGKEENDMNTEDARAQGYVIVTDYLNVNSGKDLSRAIQKIIDDNPRRTIYFPDGEYCISQPICTSSNSETAVSLHLSNFAVIKAMNWQAHDQHMIRLGVKDKTFTIHNSGSNYYLYGGCIDGAGVAKGVSIEGGRETSIRNVSIKAVTQGLHVIYNAEYGSNDADIDTVHIVGMNLPGSIGVIVDGYDNTLTDMRIAGFEVGIKLNGAGNFLRYLHTLYIYSDNYDYKDSIGFWDASGGNWYDVCYPDNFATGFRTSGHTMSVYSDCYAYWYSSNGGVQTAFASDGKFNSIVKSYRVDFHDDTLNVFLKVGEAGGGGAIEYPIFEVEKTSDKTYESYLEGRVIWRK